jgi:hypothetical protein
VRLHYGEFSYVNTLSPFRSYHSPVHRLRKKVNMTSAMLVNLDSYKYLPLGSNAIRVLGILPSPFYTAPISITLQQVSILEQTLPYPQLCHTSGAIRKIRFQSKLTASSFMSRRIAKRRSEPCDIARTRNSCGSMPFAYMSIDTKGNTTGTCDLDLYFLRGFILR